VSSIASTVGEAFTTEKNQMKASIKISARDKQKEGSPERVGVLFASPTICLWGEKSKNARAKLKKQVSETN